VVGEGAGAAAAEEGPERDRELEDDDRVALWGGERIPMKEESFEVSSALPEW